jgi:putative tryptophan/tyrosine transport system substrate-binding protein
MRRRTFLAALGSAAAWPLLARAQQSPMPTVGCLINGSPRDTAFLLAPFRNGLGELGYVESQNVAIEYRWAEGHNEALSALAAELIGLRVAVIAALGGPASALAAMTLTKSIPVVFQTGGDAKELGLVGNLNKPEGNHGFSRRRAIRSIARIVPKREILRAADKSSKSKRQEVGADHPDSIKVYQT